MTPPRLAIVLLFITALAHAADAPPSDTVPLKYIEATVAYERVKSDYPDISAVVTAIQIGKNSIILDASDARAAEVRRRLLAVDLKPRSVWVEAVVTESDEAHAHLPYSPADRILSRSTNYVLEGKPAVVCSQKGKDGKVLKVTVTSRPVIADTGK